ncbi:MAG: CSLREA domain-containing protein [Acidobacteriota bacterium]
MKNTTLFLILIGLAAPAPPAMATVFTVTKTDDTLDGSCAPRDCSLREAIAAANLTPGTDVVELPAGGYALLRVGPNEDYNETGDLDVNDPLILVGAGAGITQIVGLRADRVFDLRAGTEIFGVSILQGTVSGPGGGILARASTLGYDVVIRRSEISNNLALGSGGEGGGVMSETLGTLAVIESTLSYNVAEARGGGVYAADRLWLIDSTVSGNSGGEAGGGLYYPEESSSPIQGSTITDNHAVAGGGLYARPPLSPVIIEPHIRGSIVAGNTARDYPDCYRGYSAGHNVIGVEDGCLVSGLDRTGTLAAPLDPKLGILSTFEGGPTLARALLPGSPAFDLVPAADCTPGDQLGQARSAPCDAGAVEQPLHPACLPGGPVLCLQNGRFRVTALLAGGSPATAVPLTGDTGNFWFFSPENLELTVKVLDGCALNDRWWVFASGLTDRGVDLKVEDLFTGKTWTHSRPTAGTPFAPRLDTSALDACHPPGPGGPDVRGALAVDPVSSVLVVTKGEDTLDGACDVDCSLREAVSASNGRQGTDVILLGRRVHTLTRPGRGEGANVTGDLDVLGQLVILGSGARHSVIDGNGLDRILDSDGPLSRLEIHGVTLRNGDWGGSGGAIYAGYLSLVASHVTGNRAYSGGGVSSWDLDARDTTISDNEATFGGGIESLGFMRLSNVTVSGNRALEAGGGINLNAFDQEMNGVTVTGNRAGLYGGGVYATFETCPSSDPGCRTDFSAQRSIVAGNQAPHYPDCLGLSGSYNVFGDDGENGCGSGSTDVAGTAANPLDPKLTPLGDHGGPTPTHALLADSPAIDRAPAAGCLAADQRGRTRPAGSGCDSGAVERLPSCQPDATTLCLGGGDRFKVTARWAVRGDEGEAHSIPQTLDTGSFWFFSPANVELTLKVIDGCLVNHSFWVFASGLTDVGVDLTVEDTATGRTWTHHSAAGSTFQPRLDTNALDVCLGINP